MFNIFPLMVIPVIIYAVIVMMMGGDLNSAAFSVPMVSGGGSTMPLTQGDVLVIMGMFFLFIELVKAAGSGTATIINHAVSMLIFVVSLGLFLISPAFGTATFFLIMLMTLMDTLAGFIITIVAARRDLAVGGE